MESKSELIDKSPPFTTSFPAFFSPFLFVSTISLSNISPALSFFEDFTTSMDEECSGSLPLGVSSLGVLDLMLLLFEEDPFGWLSS